MKKKQDYCVLNSLQSKTVSVDTCEKINSIKVIHKTTGFKLAKKDFCLKSLDCVRDELAWTRKYLDRPEKILGCMCRGKNLHTCGMHFCTATKIVCDLIKQIKQL